MFDKVILVNNQDKTTYLFRKGLIRALVQMGTEVVVVCPRGDYVPKIEALGARHIDVAMKPFIAPLHDLSLFFRLWHIFRNEQPNLVHCITIKPNVYAALAARWAKVPRVVSLVCGVGVAYNPGGWKRTVLRSIASMLYRFGAKATDCIWMLNRDDRQLFIDHKITTPDKILLIRSEGIDMDEYSPIDDDDVALMPIRSELELQGDTITVYMGLGRALWSKGVRQFIEASKLLGEKRLPVRFILAGPVGPNKGADSVPAEYLISQRSENFRWLGGRDDVSDLIAISDMVTLPNIYREGIPRSLMEAMAMKKPIVTTDQVGSRETVDDRVNGFLVPTSDSQALADAIEKLALSKQLRQQFGEASYAKCRAEFEESLIVKRVLDELYQIPIDRSNATMVPIGVGADDKELREAG